MNARSIKYVLDRLDDLYDDIYDRQDGGEEYRSQDAVLARQMEAVEDARDLIKRLVVERDYEEAMAWQGLNDLYAQYAIPKLVVTR